MTVEAALTRKLGITFIDARAIATESKIRLNVSGYPNQEQKERLIAEAVSIFETKSSSEREAMQVSRDALEQGKIEAASNSSLSNSLRSSGESSAHESRYTDSSECSSVSSESQKTRRRSNFFVNR